MRRLRLNAAAAALVLTFLACPLAGQEVRGRVLDSSTAAPVAMAGVFLLDSAREVRASALADSVGRFALRVSGGGAHYLFVQRIGYFETESPLLALEDGGSYELDVEMRPEPIRLDPLRVTVRNEEMERWLTLELGGNPNAVPGFRAIQGARLEAARLEASDNADLLRRLYVPVSHGREVCLGHRMPSVDRRTGAVGEQPCGGLFVDDLPVPAEHLEEIDKREIAVIVLLPPNVRLYTYAFDWTMRPGRRR